MLSRAAIWAVLQIRVLSRVRVTRVLFWGPEKGSEFRTIHMASGLRSFVSCIALSPIGGGPPRAQERVLQGPESLVLVWPYEVLVWSLIEHTKVDTGIALLRVQLPIYMCTYIYIMMHRHM